jgi:hypothetical protein
MKNCGQPNRLPDPKSYSLFSAFGGLKMGTSSKQPESTGKHMSRFSYRTLARLLLVITVSIFISGCGITLSPVKRRPLEVFPLETSLAPNSQAILVRFESTLPGTPLSETVWDNQTGPFADVKESKQIGYTQDYSKPLLYGEAAALEPDYTRIFIPFGRIFQGVFQSGLQKVFPNSLTCGDDSCELEKLQSAASGHVVRLKVVEFQVWEKPLNHINLKAMVECKVYRAGITDQPEYEYEARHEVTSQSVGTVLTTSRGFIKKIDKISNGFAAALSEDILEKLQQKLVE